VGDSPAVADPAHLMMTLLASHHFPLVTDCRLATSTITQTDLR
jgi:hypothetical protein